MNYKREKYSFKNKKLKDDLKKKLIIKKNHQEIYLDKIGLLKFYKIDFKTIELLDLFNINEKLAFNFYIENKNKYKKICDIGANIGIHTVILCKLGYNVTSFEPDPLHFNNLTNNCKLNKIKPNLIKAGVYNQNSYLNFVRVVEHSPKSHLSVSSKNLEAYGKKKKFKVKVIKLKDLISGFDLLKIDTEGSEANMLLSLKDKKDFTSDILVEISNAKNANLIYKHLKKLKLKFYNLSNFKKKKIKKSTDMPISHLDGFLVIQKINK